MASTQPASPHDRVHRLGLVAVTLATLAMFVWLVATLAQAAFA